MLPLWSGYPDARDNRSRLRFVVGALVAAAAAFVVLLLDAHPLHDARVFVHHTFGYQFGRDSPFSLWDWGQYHAKGLPDLHWVQHVPPGRAARRRRARPLPLAAPPLAAADRRVHGVSLLLGFELVLTHWSWLYLEWFFPFVAFALLSPRAAEEPVAVAEEEPYCRRPGPGRPR